MKLTLDMINGGYSADADTLRYPTCSLLTTRDSGLGSGHPSLFLTMLAYSGDRTK